MIQLAGTLFVAGSAHEGASSINFRIETIMPMSFPSIWTYLLSIQKLELYLESNSSVVSSASKGELCDYQPYCRVIVV
ncbi:hypothetical protein GIB67_016551 [Kingdonia uniflora]|uniref:Uncharacterized protein n=1 Tax=Kingdonia uniflora TaxID=39325 RepID=A0A7J7NQB1_9MAGN|nr:hypothetical protein GIB67_016551 [Kingdonia uniflora]